MFAAILLLVSSLEYVQRTEVENWTFGQVHAALLIACTDSSDLGGNICWQVVNLLTAFRLCY